MIELRHIVKEYNKKVVLDDICFTIGQGQSVAFTGHNGCGKSTLLKVIAGLVRPTKGTVCLNMEGGHSNEEKHFMKGVHSNEKNAVIENTHFGNLIHYVPEHFPQMQLTARRYLHYMSKIDALSHTGASRHMENKCSMGNKCFVENKCSMENKCSEDKCSNEEKTFIEAPHDNKKLEGVGLETRISELAEEFFVSNMLDIPMKYLSKGSLQKIGVIQALLKEPDILLLDEPLSGQDMMSQQVFIQKIQKLQEHNVTILMSCHEPYLIDAVADEVYELDNGRLSFQGKPVLSGHGLADSWYRMFFVRTDKAAIPENWKGRLQFTGQGCILRVGEGECDRAMAEMLEAGWNLRGMRNEDDK